MSVDMAVEEARGSDWQAFRLRGEGGEPDQYWYICQIGPVLEILSFTSLEDVREQFVHRNSPDAATIALKLRIKVKLEAGYERY